MADIPPDITASLRELLARIPTNPFYARKFAGIDLAAIRTSADLAAVPFTNKAEIVEDQRLHPPYGTNRGRPLADYCRFHQTSGTSTGQPLRWLDTAESWKSLLDCWDLNFAAMGFSAADRMAFPFSFGPFLGFWTAFDAANRMGALCLPLGGLSSAARLKMIRDHEITVVFATPTYALRLAEAADFDLAGGSVRALVLAGEPGGSLPAVRAKLEAKWGARVFDHYGLTETGPVAVETVPAPNSLMVLADKYLLEIVEPGSDRPCSVGETGEIVLTTLTRVDCPLIRYRTGDLAERGEGSMLPGGIRGRCDDMIHVRGNNVYPTAIEDALRRHAVAEFRLVLDRRGPLANLAVEVEFATDCADRAAELQAVKRTLVELLPFRADVAEVPSGSLPRAEMKARRLVRRD